MKNICVFIDGTWNQPDEEETRDDYTKSTNVYKSFKIAKSVKEGQLAFYLKGVGTNGTIDYLTGGAFGWGAFTLREVMYHLIFERYEENDRIFIFGYSRGAAVARMLATYLNKAHQAPQITTRNHLSSKHSSHVITREIRPADPIPVHFLGCWDTVASFGIPAPLIGIPFHKIDLFRDMTVAANVTQAVHLLAIDETRQAFSPTLMNYHPTRVEEIWMPGVHSDVGGGGSGIPHLEQISRRLMLSKAAQAGMKLSDELDQICPNPDLVESDCPKPVERKFDLKLKARAIRVQKTERHDFTTSEQKPLIHKSVEFLVSKCNYNPKNVSALQGNYLVHSD